MRDPFIEEAVLWPIQPIYSQKLPLIASMNIGAGNIMIYACFIEYFFLQQNRSRLQKIEMETSLQDAS